MIIRNIIKKPGEQSQVIFVDDGLKDVKKLIGGDMLDTFRIGIDGVTVLADDEGLLNNSEPNIVLHGQVIYGTVVATGVNSKGDCVSLTDEQSKNVNEFLTTHELLIF